MKIIVFLIRCGLLVGSLYCFEGMMYYGYGISVKNESSFCWLFVGFALLLMLWHYVDSHLLEDE